MLTSTDKVNGFRSKVQLWQQHVESGNLEMFPLANNWQDVNTAALCEIIGANTLENSSGEDVILFLFSLHRVPRLG